MPTLELVCKRLFADSSWFLKCIVGALLLVVPVAHFFAFGYLYALIERAHRGDAVTLPEWGDWRRLFSDGIAAFVIFLALGVLPIAVAWVFTWPLRLLAFGAFVYLPLVPAVLVAPALTAAGIYQYQKREEYADAFRLAVLGAMLRTSRGRFVLPTLALIGLLAAGYPLMTFTIFAGLAAAWTYFAAAFRFMEEARKGGVRV